MNPTIRACLALGLLLSTLARPARADERLRDVACRSVHLAYPGPAASAFYNEVVVEQSAAGTYFCACGFNKGYFGLQELANGNKLVIFSVWDPGLQNDPSKVAADQRVRLLHQGEGVRIGRFGNEGTGGQSFFDFDWKVGATYRFLVTAAPADERTQFAAWFYLPEEKSWKHLVTFSTITGGQSLGGYYSFVEDFRRNRESTKHARVARFGNGWIQPTSGVWQALAKARFTADANPVTNIDAGERAGFYFLATGGDTKNIGTPLQQMIDLGTPPTKAPTDLPMDSTRSEQQP